MHPPGPARGARRIFLAFLLLPSAALVPASPVQAGQGKWALCRHVIESPQIPADAQGRTFVSADEGTISEGTIYRFRGDVEILADRQRLRADEVTYWRPTERARASGRLRYEKKNLIVEGTEGNFQLDSETGTVEKARFQLAREHGHGRAQRIFLEGGRRTTLMDSSYTTCDPGREDWQLRARKVTLNHERNVGTARHAWLSFMKIPLFYSPYLSFPLNNQRKSGFLVPTIGRSNKLGRELALPYYLNLAPNYDATITPNYFSRRGLLMMGEFRYLTTRNGGQINLEIIDQDKAYGDQRRGALTLRHDGTPWPRVRSALQYNYVSDADYLNDFGRSLSLAAVSHLPQMASLNYAGETLSAGLLLQSFQTVDDTIPDSARPYQRLPQFTLDLSPQDQSNRPVFTLESELVNFQRTDRVSGLRADLQPAISLPLEHPGAFLEPRLKLAYTAYDLSELPPGGEARPQRTVPLFSLDGGLFLERWYGPLLHTVEPRLFYLYVPRRDQSDIPLFDTGLPDFNFNQLFRDNRFTNVDRIGDANQLSVALTTRLVNKDGVERLVLKGGQILYFQDREVTLGSAPETRGRSDIVAEATANLTAALTLTGDLRWDTELDTVDKGAVGLRYRPGHRRVLNLSYRYRNDTLEQSDVSLLWPLHRNWHIMGRWNRDLLKEQTLETLGGLEYQNCCWRVNFLARRYLKRNGEDSVTYYVEFEFKGLASLGRDMEAILGNAILGYRK